MVDGHHLLPCPQPQATLADRQGDRRSQQGGLDVAVTVAVMPGQFVGVGRLRRCQTSDGVFEILNNAGFVFDGGDCCVLLIIKSFNRV